MTWIRDIWTTIDPQNIKKSFIYCGIQKHIFSGEDLLLDCSLLHSVLRYSIENGTAIGNYIDNDLELSEAMNVMDENYPDIFIENQDSHEPDSK